LGHFSLLPPIPTLSSPPLLASRQNLFCPYLLLDKDLNIRPETLKLVQEGAANTLEIIGIGKDFLNRTPKAQQLRERMDKWDFIKLKSFYTTKETVSKLKRPPQSGRKYLPAIHQTKD
jgi:hypothetical protein